MIISCTNCQKKFDVKDNLIPKSGRLLECSSCKHKWFFKNDVLVLKKTTKEKIASEDQIKEFSEEEIPKDVENIIKEAEISKVNNQKKLDKDYKKKPNKISFLNLLLVLIISFLALIIILDTFRNPINSMLPGFNFMLDNFYESLKDLFLFFKDLTR